MRVVASARSRVSQARLSPNGYPQQEMRVRNCQTLPTRYLEVSLQTVPSLFFSLLLPSLPSCHYLLHLPFRRSISVQHAKEHQSSTLRQKKKVQIERFMVHSGQFSQSGA
ncbi:hypothetical protein TNCV_241951 [Trichonephila clavipes]|uniref:Uncharacterized protein n=1 Tax=Trichonephila clavipes TaxID=2585209 RepID=A0A8X6W405_TRICX|nr:hypothetical protein TNCV_241951 [Trichonephila clavipes]